MNEKMSKEVKDAIDRDDLAAMQKASLNRMERIKNMNPDMIADQKIFQLTFGHGVLPFPQIPAERIQERRRMLVEEEFNKEFLVAWETCNNLSRLPADNQARKELEAEALGELGDAIADAIYVLIGTAFEYGIPLAAIWKAVQEANMSKLWTSEELAKVPREEGFTANVSPLHGHTFMGDPKTKMYLVHNRAGKVMKPPSWKAPDITEIICKARTCTMDVPNDAQTPPDQQARREEWNRALATEAQHGDPLPADAPERHGLDYKYDERA